MNKLVTLKRLLTKLRSYAVVTIAIEVICVGLIGLGSSQVGTFFSPWTILMVFSALILVIIILYRYSYVKDFPETLVDSISGELLSQSLAREKSRISLINDSIAKSLISLNVQTCQLEFEASGDNETYNEPVENKLCDKGLKQGLTELNDGFLRNLHHIAESSQSKFSVGVYLKFIYHMPTDSSGGEVMDVYSPTFLIKDDLDLTNQISEDLIIKEGASGLELEIQSWITACFNNEHQLFHSKLREDSSLSFYANTIPEVCEEGRPAGVLFILANNFLVIPNDFDEVTKIQNRIITNWISKYNQCVLQKANIEL